MAPSIDNAFIQEYKDLVIHLAQQGDNRLRQYVTEVDSGGETYYFDRLAATDALTKTGRRQASSAYYVDDVWDRRACSPITKVHLMTLEHEDKVQMLIDPENAYAENQAMAMRRAYDDLIIAAATGDATDGDGNPVTFPAGQTIGNGTAAIDFDYVAQVQETFLANEIGMDVPKVMVVGPTQVRQLLQLAVVTSADYVTREALQKLSQWGIVPNWMGFTWIVSNRLLAPAAGQLSCLAFTKRALGLVVNMDMMVRIGENPDALYMIQVFAQFTANAVRVEDEHIVELHVLDS